MKDFFDQTIDILKTDLQLHIEEGQSKPNYSEFKKHVILFVGGFAQSDYLKQELRELAKLLRLPLVIPPNPSEAIVIGAAMLSSSPGKIDERCMVTSYGTPVQAIYDPTIHSKVAHLKKQRYDGEWVIDNTFSAFVREGQMVKFDECVRKSFFPIRQGQKSVTLKIYSNDSDKGIVLDKKCHYICETTLYFPEQFINDDPGKNKITLSISFGQSEMVITCIHERSGTSCEVKANYGE